VPVRRGDAGRHGRRHLHGLAGLLHGRDRRVPAPARRPAARRPPAGSTSTRSSASPPSRSGSAGTPTRSCC
jgi:hypothetical protein